MRNNVFRKNMAILVIVLFIGTGIIPMIRAYNNDDNKNILNDIIHNLATTNWWDPDWDYSKEITINHDLVEANLQDFPILFQDISSDYSNHAQDDGDDFVFVSADNTTKFSHEIELFDSSSGELVAWVSIPSISISYDTIFYMYYGNLDCDNQEDTFYTWDSDFIHVWHLGDDLIDSAGYNDGSNQGTEIVTGKIGYARDFEQSQGDYINLGDMVQPADSSLTTITWEGWVKLESLQWIITCKYNSQGSDYASYWIGFNEVGKFKFWAWSSWDSGTGCNTNDSYAIMDQWVYLTAVFNLGGLNELKAYINGEEVALTYLKRTGNYMRNYAISDDIGRYRPESGTKYYDGLIDEMRWSKIIRSDSWIKTSYNTMNSPNDFLNIGPESQFNLPPNIPSNPSPPDGAIDVSIFTVLSWTCNDPDNDELTYDVYFGTSNDPPLVSSGQPQNYYDPPGELIFNTQYFWKIVAEDENGANSTSPVWSFTTSNDPNNPPNIPSEPSPPDKSVDVDVNTLLSWSGGDPDGDEVFYDVYLEVDDSTPDVLVSNDQDETIFNPGILLTETVYYWQIIAKDEYGASTPGPVWSFTTKHEIVNFPPDTPNISGPSSGKVGISIIISAETSDPEDDQIFYWFDWGDNTNTGWVGPYESGLTVQESHIWNNQGDFHIKVKAKDIFDNESSWDSHNINIPRNKIVINTILHRLYQNYPNLFILLQKILCRFG